MKKIDTNTVSGISTPIVVPFVQRNFAKSDKSLYLFCTGLTLVIVFNKTVRLSLLLL